MDSLLVSSVVVGRNWSQLPNDLLLPILQRLEINDLLCSAVVSTSWRSAAAELRRLRLPSRPTTPWLVICGGEREDLCDPTSGDFYSLSDDKVYTISLPDPPFRRRCCKGSSQGWLITCDDRWELHLLNPITRVQIDLPPVSTLSCIAKPVFKNDEDAKGSGSRARDGIQDCNYTRPELRDYTFVKAVLSSSPSEGSNYIVAIIHRPGWVISLARAGDREWSTLPRPRSSRYSYYHDCVFHGGQLYAVVQRAEVEVWDLEHGNWKSQQPKIIELPYEDIESNYVYHFPYLVCTPWGDLLQVRRYTNWRHEELSVTVYKMDLERQRFVEVESIGDHALFLGGNQSLCLSCKDLPMLKPNSVYLTEEWWPPRYQFRYVGVYSLEGATFQPIFPDDSRFNRIPPIWLTPRF